MDPGFSVGERNHGSLQNQVFRDGSPQGIEERVQLIPGSSPDQPSEMGLFYKTPGVISSLKTRLCWLCGVVLLWFLQEIEVKQR